jgi:maltoporin
MLAYSTLDKNTFVVLEGEDSSSSLRQAYATAANVLESQPGATFWAGQRYYRRHDIHINDFYWLDMSGYGGGIEDIDLGFATASLAWIGGTTDNFSGRNEYIGDLETTDKNNFDLRLNDIDLGIGRGNIWLNYSRYRLDAENIELTDWKGWSGGFWLESAFGDGHMNRAVIQYGSGVAANFNSFSPSLRGSLDGEFPEGTNPEDQSRLRLMNILDYAIGDRVSLQAVAIYQHDDLGLAENTDVKWYSLGVRPIYNLSDLFNLSFEASYDYSDLETGQSGGLWKFTAATEVTPDPGFFSRPAIRFYLTYAGWSDEFRGLIGGNAHAEDTYGLAVGVQVESWW